MSATYEPASLYSNAITHRQSSLPSTRAYWPWDVMSRIDLEWYFVEATTSDFQTSYAEDGYITLYKTSGSAGATLLVNRNDSDIWAPQPSTLFYPGASSSDNRGFLLVSGDFFTNHGLTKASYAGDPTKYPKAMGELARAALKLVQHLNTAEPHSVARATAQLDDAGKTMIANFLATSRKP